MQNRTVVWLILFLLFLVCASSCQPSTPPFECTDAIGCVSIPPDKPIILGSLQVLDTEITTAGHEQIRSIELAMNQRGKAILGHPVEVHSEDTYCTAEGGANAALKIVADPQVVAILGTICSNAATTASEIISEEGLTIISGMNVAPSLTGVGGTKGEHWQAGYFRTRVNSAEQGYAVATFARQELGISKAATIHDGDAYTREFSEPFEERFEELGGEIVTTVVINKGDTDMRPALTTVANFGAELIFLSLFQPEGIPIVQQIPEVPGLENVALIGVDALVYQGFIDAVGSKGKGMYFIVTLAPPSPANLLVISAYEARFHETPSVFYPYLYDASALLIDTIERTAVKDADGTLRIGRQALRDALYATVDYEGITGQLSCNHLGDCGARRFTIIQLNDPTAGIEGLITNIVDTIELED